MRAGPLGAVAAPQRLADARALLLHHCARQTPVRLPASGTLAHDMTPPLCHFQRPVDVSPWDQVT